MISRVILADDHTIIRRGLRNLMMARYPHLTILDAESWNALDRLLNVEQPDMVVLDLQLGDRNAMDSIAELRRRVPAMRILVYSMNPEHIYSDRVLGLGCAGYLTKESSEEEVMRAVDIVVRGGIYRSHGQEMRALDHGSTPMPEGGHDLFGRLSDRELLVMEKVLAGAGVKEIAAVMDLSPSTVATYKARLFDKLGVANLVELQRLTRAHQYPGQ